jgi:AraC-like DNA-binding protein
MFLTLRADFLTVHDMTRPPSTIAATSTLAMVRAAEARGVATADLLAESGLTQELLEDPDARLPGSVVLSVWQRLRDRTADPLLQLAAPVSLPFGAYRVLDYLVGASATVGEGVERFARFFGLIADAIALSIECDDGAHCLRLARADGGAVPPVYVDYVFAALVTRIRMKIRPALRVLRVELRQPEPAADAVHARVFRAPVHFDAPADRLCFADAEWRAPMDSADAALAHVLEEHARILARRTPTVAAGFCADVEKTIASALAEGASAQEVARALHCSVRTLQRKLVATGTTFRQVSDTVRGQLAVDYLSDSNVSIAEVAFLLGFSDQSSFNRAFRRWTGEPPGRWRRTRVRSGTEVRSDTSGTDFPGEE